MEEEWPGRDGPGPDIPPQVVCAAYLASVAFFCERHQASFSWCHFTIVASLDSEPVFRGCRPS